MNTYRTSTTCMLSFMIVSSVLLLDFASTSASALDCTPGNGCYYRYEEAEDHDIYSNRKMLMELVRSSLRSIPRYVDDEGKMNDDVEMRNVPAGPDPLHHNGGPQKKPRISP